MKHLFFMMIFVFFIVACAQQQTVSENAAEHPIWPRDTMRPGDIPCFMSDAGTDFFACTGIVETTKGRIEEALQMALIQAQNMCFAKVQYVAGELVCRSCECLLINSEKHDELCNKMREEYKKTLQTLIMQRDHQNKNAGYMPRGLKGTNAACMKIDPYADENGRLSVYVSVKIPRKDVADALKKVTADLIPEEYNSDSSEEIDKMVQNFDTGTESEQVKHTIEHTVRLE